MTGLLVVLLALSQDMDHAPGRGNQDEKKTKKRRVCGYITNNSDPIGLFRERYGDRMGLRRLEIILTGYVGYTIHRYLSYYISYEKRFERL